MEFEEVMFIRIANMFLMRKSIITHQYMQLWHPTLYTFIIWKRMYASLNTYKIRHDKKDVGVCKTDVITYKFTIQSRYQINDSTLWYLTSWDPFD